MPKRILLIWRLVACLGLSVAAASAAELDPKIWEKEIAAFEAADRRTRPAEGGVLFVGSSSIRFWTNLAEAFPEHQVISRGFGGSHLPDATYYFDRIVLPYRPSKIVLYAGDNDIAKGRSPEQVFADFREFAAKLRSALPGTKLYFLAIKPSPSRWHLSPQAREANRLVRRYCAVRSRLEFIDVWTPLIGSDGRPDPALFLKDNLHINGKGYERWAKVVRKALKD